MPKHQVCGSYRRCNYHLLKLAKNYCVLHRNRYCWGNTDAQTASFYRSQCFNRGYCLQQLLHWVSQNATSSSHWSLSLAQDDHDFSLGGEDPHLSLWGVYNSWQSTVTAISVLGSTTLKGFWKAIMSMSMNITSWPRSSVFSVKEVFIHPLWCQDPSSFASSYMTGTAVPLTILSPNPPTHSSVLCNCMENKRLSPPKVDLYPTPSSFLLAKQILLQAWVRRGAGLMQLNALNRPWARHEYQPCNAQ